VKNQQALYFKLILQKEACINIELKKTFCRDIDTLEDVNLFLN
jgi:hypothetical protein|tara:strand:- start:1585 stop:1713 length:129 start_codon:yes stop_codon:yes gene_type:complete